MWNGYGYDMAPPMMPPYNHNNRNNMYMPYTNKRFVNSLDEALSIRSEYNSEMVYFDNNQDVLYNIRTNGRGEKTWDIVDLSLRKDATQNPNDPITILNKRFDDLEKRLETIQNEYNVKQTDTKSKNE